MAEPYFWPMGKCSHCGWPHHLRLDLPARPKRWWRKGRPALSGAMCCNCMKRTVLDPPEEADRD